MIHSYYKGIVFYNDNFYAYNPYKTNGDIKIYDQNLRFIKKTSINSIIPAKHPLKTYKNILLLSNTKKLFIITLDDSGKISIFTFKKRKIKKLSSLTVKGKNLSLNRRYLINKNLLCFSVISKNENPYTTFIIVFSDKGKLIKKIVKKSTYPVIISQLKNKYIVYILNDTLYIDNIFTGKNFYKKKLPKSFHRSFVFWNGKKTIYFSTLKHFYKAEIPNFIPTKLDFAQRTSILGNDGNNLLAVKAVTHFNPYFESSLIFDTEKERFIDNYFFSDNRKNTLIYTKFFPQTDYKSILLSVIYYKNFNFYKYSVFVAIDLDKIPLYSLKRLKRFFVKIIENKTNNCQKKQKS